MEALSDLTRDKVWFVRLRAVVSLGQLRHPSAITPLLNCMCDSNRLVRLRAAEALVNFNRERVMVFERVVARRDRYGLYAYIAAIDNAGLQKELEVELKLTAVFPETYKDVLLEVLRTGVLPPERADSEAVAHAGASV